MSQKLAEINNLNLMHQQINSLHGMSGNQNAHITNTFGRAHEGRDVEYVSRNTLDRRDNITNDSPFNEDPLVRGQYLDARASSALGGGGYQHGSAFKNGSNLSHLHLGGPQTTLASTVAQSAMQTQSHRKQNQRQFLSPGPPSTNSKSQSRERRLSAHKYRSRSRSSWQYQSEEPDRKDHAFIYPCRAFKQFFLTLKEGKINLNDIERGRFHPEIMQMLNPNGVSISSTPDITRQRKSGSRSQRPQTSRSPNLMRGQLPSNRSTSRGHQPTVSPNKEKIINPQSLPNTSLTEPSKKHSLIYHRPSSSITPYQPSNSNNTPYTKSIRDQIEESSDDELEESKYMNTTQKSKGHPNQNNSIRKQSKPTKPLDRSAHKTPVKTASHQKNKSVILSPPPHEFMGKPFEKSNKRSQQPVAIQPQKQRKEEINPKKLEYNLNENHQTPVTLKAKSKIDDKQLNQTPTTSTFMNGPQSTQKKAPAQMGKQSTPLKNSEKKVSSIKPYQSQTASTKKQPQTYQQEKPLTLGQSEPKKFQNLRPKDVDKKMNDRLKQYLTSPSAFSPSDQNDRSLGFEPEVAPVILQQVPQPALMHPYQQNSPVKMSKPEKYDPYQESSDSMISDPRPQAYMAINQPLSEHHKIASDGMTSGMGQIAPDPYKGQTPKPASYNRSPINSYGAGPSGSTKTRPSKGPQNFGSNIYKDYEESLSPRESSNQIEETKYVPMQSKLGEIPSKPKFSTRPSNNQTPVTNKDRSLRRRRNDRGQPGSNSIDRVVGTWTNPLPQRGVNMTPQNNTGFQGRMSMKRQSSVGDNMLVGPNGSGTNRGQLIDDFPQNKPDHRSSGSASAKNKRRGATPTMNNNPSMPNLSNFRSQDDPSRYDDDEDDNGNHTRSRPTPNNTTLNKSRSPLGNTSRRNTLPDPPAWNNSTNPNTFYMGPPKYVDPFKPKSNHSRSSKKRKNKGNGTIEEEEVMTPTSNSYYTSSKPSVPKNTEFTYQGQPVTMDNAKGKLAEDYMIHALEEKKTPGNKYLRSQSTLKTPQSGTPSITQQPTFQKRPTVVQPTFPAQQERSVIMKNPEGSPSSLHISSLMSPGTKGGMEPKQNHFDDTFPSAICGTIGYGHVGPGGANTNNHLLQNNANKPSRVTREQRRMRHSSMGDQNNNWNGLDNHHHEDEEQLRQPKKDSVLGSIVDLIDVKRPVFENQKPQLLQEPRALVHERRPTGKFGLSENDPIYMLTKRDSSPRDQNLPLQMRIIHHSGHVYGHNPRNLQQLNQINQNPSLLTSQSNDNSRKGSPNEESKRKERRNRDQRSNQKSPVQNHLSQSPPLRDQVPTTPEQDQTLKNFITQLSPTKYERNNIIPRPLPPVKDVSSKSNRRKTSQDIVPKQTFGQQSAAKTQQNQQVVEPIEEFKPLIESPKYNIDEPLTIGITSSGSHLKDSFGARPQQCNTNTVRLHSPTEVIINGRPTRLQRSQERSPTNDDQPKILGLKNFTSGVDPLIINRVEVQPAPFVPLPQMKGFGGKVSSFQSPEDINPTQDPIQKPLSQRFSSLYFEERKNSNSPAPYGRKSSLPLSQEKQPQKPTLPLQSPGHLTSSDRIPNSAYETPQNTGTNKRQSKFREVEGKLKQHMNRSGATFKQIDYRLIIQLQNEAAKVIQREYRLHISRIIRKKYTHSNQNSAFRVASPSRTTQPLSNKANTLSGRTFAATTSPKQQQSQYVPPFTLNNQKHPVSVDMATSPLYQQQTNATFTAQQRHAQPTNTTSNKAVNTDLSCMQCCCSCHNQSASSASCHRCRNGNEQMRKLMAGAIMWTYYMVMCLQMQNTNHNAQQCCLHRECAQCQRRR